MEEVHFNTALLSVDDGGALCDRRIMTIKNIIVKKSNHEHDIIWKEVSDLVDEGLAMELEEEAGEDFRRIRSHVMNEVEEEKEEKYKQLEFEFDEDLVAPI